MSPYTNGTVFFEIAGEGDNGQVTLTLDRIGHSDANRLNPAKSVWLRLSVG